MLTRAKLYLLRCSNSWETAVTGTSLKRWSCKRAWCTQKMRKWWTDRCEARTSAIWKRSAKPISWKAGSRWSQSIDRSRSESPFNSWQSRECPSSIRISWIGTSTTATFEQIQMDTNSNYIAIYADGVRTLFDRPELRAEFESTEKWWVAWDKAMRRQPDDCAMLEMLLCRWTRHAVKDSFFRQTSSSSSSSSTSTFGCIVIY